MSSDVKAELVALERRYWQALKDNDVATAIELTSDPCIVAGAQGVGEIDHAAYKAMMGQPGWSLDAFELDEPTVRLIGPDAAVVAYTVRETLTIDGDEVAFEAADTSTWVRQSGRWVCAMHSESIMGDPFGRDRRSASAMENERAG